MATGYEDRIAAILATDPVRRDALSTMAALDLPDGWIAAGFVRDAVWDHLHGHPARAPAGDVDVVWFDSTVTEAQRDRQIERALRRARPGLRWSVKNQARMHHRNADAPYGSVADAMRHWPETATAVAVRLTKTGAIVVNAPFGLADLFALRVRPTPAFRTDKLRVAAERATTKRWTERYPLLSLDAALTAVV